MGDNSSKIGSYGAVAAPLNRITGTNQKSFRLKLGLGAVGLLLVNLAVGFFARDQHQATINHAMNIYDTAITSTSYVREAQLSFQHFVDERKHAASSAEVSLVDEQLGKVLDELEVAIERADSPGARADAQAVREQIIALAGLKPDELAAPFAAIQAALEQLAQRASIVLLRARDEIEAFSARGDLLLLGSIFTSLLLAGLTLALLRHLVAQSTVARITHMATYDSLTGLPNRVLMLSRLAQMLAGSRRRDALFAVLSLDLDRFKYVNDTLGHHTGDLLLMEVARRIEGLLRNTDLVARFGGDEFVILQTPVSEPAEAGALADRLVAAIGAPYEINGQRILIGASVGVAIAPADGEDADELLRNSDVALFRAKADGKGLFRYFTAEMNAVMQRRRLMELDLREAVEKCELEVFFQPLVDISTGRLDACEALVRWTQASRGPVSPADFIPLAEETGLIVPLGEYVLRAACAEAAAWPGGAGVAVNLSAVQFRSGNLPLLVSSILAETGLAATRLELEITESVLIDDKDVALQTLKSLHALGVRVALDDFGTGYSSLAYLSSFPFDKIKIDRSFVRDVANRPEAAGIIRAILSLAGTLNMSTIAEGVENVEELEWLRQNGCKQVQGFLFSKAVSAREIRQLMGVPMGPGVSVAAAKSIALLGHAA